jgi:FKBP12-rapamycin complex-associated protein
MLTSKDSVDAALVRLLSDSSVARDILTVFLDLIAFFNKEKKQFPKAVLEAAKRCALTKFKGELHQSVPGIVLWYAEQQTADNISAQAIADNLVEINIRFVCLRERRNTATKSPG